MSITPSFRIALAFFILFQTEVQAKNNDPCSDGTLKGWARRAGYSAADCAPAPAPNSAPEITILSPESGAQFTDGMAIDLNATARDAQDGDLSATIVWQPSGSNGGSVVLPTGEHVLTASVTDSGGLTVTRDLVVTVTEPVVATTGSAALRWLVPLTRENGEPLSPSELGGYEIYVAHEESNADRIIAVNDATIDNYVVEDLADGTHHFAIVAIDINGLKSALSESVSEVVTGGESIVAAQP
jgi:hypothetical protein